MTYLLQNVSVDTTGEGLLCDGANKMLAIWAASFGGGSVTIQISPDNGTTWITANYSGSPAVFTSNSAFLLNRCGQGVLLRAVLSGSTLAENVNVAIYQ